MNKKPTTCKCRQPYYRMMERWRVIERREVGSSRLKCLECGWRWWSKRKYVGRLANHKEYSRKGLTDVDILQRLENGSLLVDTKRAVVISFSKYGKTILAKTERESNGSAYRFVEICSNGKKKKIALHRLVWMARYRVLVPEGYDVHHRRGTKVPNPDSEQNLELLQRSINRSIKGGSYVPF